MTNPTTVHLPDDFVWGVAASAYQIEGGVDRDGRGASIWDVFSHSGRVRNDDNGDIACDHRTRWAEDLDLIAALGVPAYRLSLSWARLQAQGRGPLSPSAVEWYRQLLGGMHLRGITPWVTLYHWDLPEPLQAEGGWPNRATAERFGDYVELVLDAVGDLAADWVTVNEPWCSSFLGYGYGVHAPGHSDLREAVASAHHLNLAHGLATQAIRTADPRARVGITNIVADLVPADAQRDATAVARLDAVNHQLFLSPVYAGRYSDAVHDLLDPYGLAAAIRDGDLELIGMPTDFVGLNHYQRVIVTEDPTVELTRAREQPAGPAHTSFGWSITPDALTSVLRSIKEQYTDLPIYITENGASFDDVPAHDGSVEDLDRVDYLTGYLQAVDDAAAAGVPVAGYFAWSLLDNFEWAEGYDKRFGLVYVDFTSQRRIPKRSAHHYAAIVAAHARQQSAENSAQKAHLQ